MCFQPTKYRRLGNYSFFGYTFITCILIILFSHDTSAKTTTFPLYSKIKTNVQFWQDIYGRYSLNEAVIHDSVDLSKVYGVIQLLSPELPGAKKFNSIVEKRAKKHYAVILKKLSRSPPNTGEERRIAALFSGRNIRRQMARAAKNIRSQNGQKERFLAGVRRSQQYMQEIKQIFRHYNLPEDLAYLPHVESSFNIRAYSKYGAAGIWQFTRGTGKQYLTISYSLDERLDPVLATHAAAKYLKNSFQSLGNWPLALTSYNYGTAGMQRALRDHGSYEKIFTHYDKGRFKFAARNFYSEFLAALKVARKLEKNLPNSGKKRSYRVFTLPGYLHIQYVQRYLSVSPIEIARNNPALLPPVLKGEKLIPKGYTLRLPADKKIRRRIASIPEYLYKNKQQRSPFHRVLPGETAHSIARSYNISLQKLKRINKLDKHATIYARQKLKIPRRDSTPSRIKINAIQIRFHGNPYITNHLKTKKNILLLASKKKRFTRRANGALPKHDPTAYNMLGISRQNNILCGYITVQPQETIALYATWLATTTQKILALNTLETGADVNVGQKIFLELASVSPGRFKELRLAFLKKTEERFLSTYSVVGKKKYRVNLGDTLWNICHTRFNIPLWLLRRYNSTLDLSHLQTAQELIIPIVRML